MADQQKGKNIFDQAIDLVSNRDEKAALEAAKKHMAEVEQQLVAQTQRAETAERKVAELQAALNKTQADAQASLSKSQAEGQGALGKTQSELQAAKATIAQLEQRLAVAEPKAKLYDEAQIAARLEADSLAAQKAATLATHTTAANETLGDLALKYYGHATPAYWQLIYEANKAAIGDNPNRVKAGLSLRIPVLPPELKK